MISHEEAALIDILKSKCSSSTRLSLSYMLAIEAQELSGRITSGVITAADAAKSDRASLFPFCDAFEQFILTESIPAGPKRIDQIADKIARSPNFSAQDFNYIGLALVPLSSSTVLAVVFLAVLNRENLRAVIHSASKEARTTRTKFSTTSLIDLLNSIREKLHFPLFIQSPLLAAVLRTTELTENGLSRYGRCVFVQLPRRDELSACLKSPPLINLVSSTDTELAVSVTPDRLLVVLVARGFAHVWDGECEKRLRSLLSKGTSAGLRLSECVICPSGSWNFCDFAKFATAHGGRSFCCDAPGRAPIVRTGAQTYLCFRCFLNSKADSARFLAPAKIGCDFCGQAEPAKLLSAAQAERMQAVLSVVADAAAESFPSRIASVSLSWLASFVRFGDRFQELVVAALTPRPLQRILEMLPGASRRLAEFVHKILMRLLSNADMKIWLTGYILRLCPSLAYAESEAAHRRLIALVSVQLFRSEAVLQYCEDIPEFPVVVASLLERSAKAMVHRPPDADGLGFLWALTAILKALCREDAATAILNCLKELQFLYKISLKRVPEAVAGWVDVLRIVISDLVSILRRLCNAKEGLKKLHPKEVLKKLYRLYEEWETANPIRSFDVSHASFSLILPLEEAFLAFMPTKNAESLLNWVERPLLAAAAMSLAAVTETCWDGHLAEIARGTAAPDLSVRIFSLFAAYLRTESDPTPFISIALEAFGIRPNAATVEPLRFQLVCRFFVQLMALFFPEGTSKRAVARLRVIHLLANETFDIAELRYMDDSTYRRYQLVLQEVGIPFAFGGKQTYKLNPAFENEVSPFWIRYSSDDFLNLLVAKRPFISIPEINPQTCGFVMTQPFIDFLANAAANLPGDFACVETFSALLRATARASNIVNSAEPFATLVGANAFKNFADRRFLALCVDLQDNLASQAAYFGDIVKSIPVSAATGGIDRSEILERFAQSRAEVTAVWNVDEAEEDVTGEAGDGYYIDRLEYRLADFYSGEVGAQVLALSKTDNVACCLICVKIATTIERDHPVEGGICTGHAWMKLTGEDATATTVVGPDGFGPGRPVYVTEEGDEDVGFKYGLPLVLSRERCEALKKAIAKIGADVQASE
jgi:hypothetical protein